MRFSTRSEYGLRLMVNLADSYYKNEKKSLPQIAKEERLSLPYLERLISRLKKGKMISSTKGVTGGYVLIQDPRDISVAKIVEMLEGDLVPSKCIFKVQKNMCQHKDCVSKSVWFRLHEVINKTLKEISLGDLIKNK